MTDALRVLFIGDVFAHRGRELVTALLPGLRKTYAVDFCIVNAENATHGRGLCASHADALLDAGADCLTLGNHTWSHAGIYRIIDEYPVLRPANFAEGLPGRGSTVLEHDGRKLGVLNLQGRTYMDPCENPFTCAMREIARLREVTPNILIDFHAEATAEKIALAYYTQGLVSAVVGTHTHVQTADERILEGGTAFITDVGMTGPTDGIIGMDIRNVLQKFVKCVPSRFEPSDGEAVLCAVLLEIEEQTGCTRSIQRLQIGK